MSNAQHLEPAYVPVHKPENPGRRKMLLAATTGVSAVGVGFLVAPFLASWLPSERAKAIGAPIEVDFSKLEAGALQTALWQGKVIYILRRTPEMLATLDTLTDRLRDPDSKESIQPTFADNVWRAEREDVAVMLGVLYASGLRTQIAVPAAGARRTRR